MTVSSQLFEAFLECPTKCWLRSRAEPAARNTYADWARARNETYYQESIKRLFSRFPVGGSVTGAPVPKSLTDATWRLAIGMHLQKKELESRLQAIQRISSEDRGGTVQLIPYRFEFANKLTKKHKLLLAFDALLLSEDAGCKVSFGKIVHGAGHATLKVRTDALVSEVRSSIRDITALLAANSPPDLVLNRHCGQCEFQVRCRRQAIEKDELSLLSSMLEKERKKFHSKGIFTITQLSYTFRPRRRRRESAGKEKYHHSLRARAIRESKIHAVGVPEPKLHGTPVFLDVEGLPDSDFYYLIGVRIGSADGPVHHGFWANDSDEENRIWNELLGVLAAIPNPQFIHYGRYETIFLKRMYERYGGPHDGSALDVAIKHATNLLSLVFAQIYFPTFSNGLKDIAGCLGYRWSGSPASGLEAIVWRHQWEASRDPAMKQALLDYNRQDCEAVELVLNSLVELRQNSTAEGSRLRNEVILTSELNRESPFKFRRNAFVYPEMETINKAAYWDYQRERVYVKSHHKSTRNSARRPSGRKVLRARPEFS